MRKIIFLLIAILLVGCQVAQVPVTVIVTPEPPTDVPEPPTPTQENQDWIDMHPLNPNWWMMDGCTPLVFDARQFCLPYAWSINQDVFDQDAGNPAPDAKLIQGNSPDDSYLEMRIDYLNYELCLSQDRLFLDEADSDGELNYVFKLTTELVPQGDFDFVQRPVVTFSIGAKDLTRVWSAIPVPVDTGLRNYLWVITPTQDYDNGVSYKWCFDLNSMEDANLNIVEASLIRAGRAWGNDIAEAFAVDETQIVDTGEY